VVLAFSGHNHSNYTKEINGITYMQINSASYVWIGKPTMTEKRFSEEINKKYSIIKAVKSQLLLYLNKLTSVEENTFHIFYYTNLFL
jgi:hypothetical protein